MRSGFCLDGSQSLFLSLQVSALQSLAACHYLPEMREKIFTVLYKAINSNVKELQEAGKEAMKKVCVCVCVCVCPYRAGKDLFPRVYD